MINFIRYKNIYFAISALFLIPGIISLLIWGLNPSIDFTGGTVWEIQFNQEVSQDELTQLVQTQKPAVEVNTREGNVMIFRFDQLDKEVKEDLAGQISEQVGEFSEVRYENVGPVLGQELVAKTVIGVILAAVLILIYVAWRFKDRMYGICAVLAMFHDTVIVLGIFSLLGHFYGVEIDTLFVTAVLTVLSFSVHDTVVIFDQIREIRRLWPRESFAKVVNRALSETIVRSINNSVTIILVLLALLLLGGSTIRWFVVALLIGTIAGTYSSTFTAAPLLVVWYNYFNKK